MLKKLSVKLSSILEKSSRRSEPSRFQPSLEAFEERLVPTVTVQPTYYGGHYIHIVGSDAKDVVTITKGEGRQRHTIFVTENGVTTRINNPLVTSPYGGTASRWISSIFFEGNNGNDRFINDTDLRSTAIGGNGNDYFEGGSNVDVFDGGAGEDSMFGKGGDDQLYGGVNRDYIFGGGGADKLDGGDDGAADFLKGGAGMDQFQMEGYGNRNIPYLLYFNLDDPSDYTAGEDTFYGEDSMVIGPIEVGPILL